MKIDKYSMGLLSNCIKKNQNSKKNLLSQFFDFFLKFQKLTFEKIILHKEDEHDKIDKVQ